MLTLPDGRQFYSSPDDDTIDAYLSWVKTAKSKIRIGDYSFNLAPLVDLLIQLKGQGIDIKLVLDKSQAGGSTEKPEITKLSNAGIDFVLGTSQDHKIYHNKFTVIDDLSCQYGSWNYTAVASKESNFFLIDPEPTVTLAFSQMWEEGWSWITANEKQ